MAENQKGKLARIMALLRRNSDELTDLRNTTRDTLAGLTELEGRIEPVAGSARERVEARRAPILRRRRRRHQILLIALVISLLIILALWRMNGG